MRLSAMTAALIALVVAGCEGRSDPVNQAEGAANATLAGVEGENGMIADPRGVGAISVAEREPFGRYLVDGTGRTLYVLEPNAPARPNAADNCTDACLGEWPPAMAAGAPRGGTNVDASRLGTVARDDGQQLTYNGRPLYYYRADRDPGQVAGQNVHDRWGRWYLISPEGEPIREGRDSPRGSAPHPPGSGQFPQPQ
ncbi:MAG TPA: hypothetical protein VM346_06690 [Sphingomicrobium sp.]|nr:hypothetical protein [Sphingomicrobium sp.]